MTTIPGSTAPAARRWLYEQLLTLPADPDDQQSSMLVCYDEPGTNQPGDIISVGGIAREITISAMVGSGGAGWLEERYTIALVIDVYRGGPDAAQVSFDRGAALLDQVVALVRADPTLGGAVLVGRPTQSQTEGFVVDDHMGRQSVVNVGIECYARI